MSREIKFRVWCNNNKEWEKDSVFIDARGYLFQIDSKRRINSLRKDAHFINFYTGLKDKNDKEIYKGDIVEGGYLNPLTGEFLSRKYIVEYSEGCFQGKLIGHTPYGDTWLQFIKGEVIGNIYEDKELLEV